MGDNSEAITLPRWAVRAPATLRSDDLATDDFVQEWPQSGERISAEGSKKLNEQYSEQTGSSPKMGREGHP